MYNQAFGQKAALYVLHDFRGRKEVPRFYFLYITLISSCILNISSHSSSLSDLRDVQPPVERTSWHGNLLCSCHQLWTLLKKEDVWNTSNTFPAIEFHKKICETMQWIHAAISQCVSFTVQFHKRWGFNAICWVRFLPRIFSGHCQP